MIHKPRSIPQPSKNIPNALFNALFSFFSSSGISGASEYDILGWALISIAPQDGGTRKKTKLNMYLWIGEAAEVAGVV